LAAPVFNSFMPMRKPLLIASTAAMLLFAAGCGGDDGDPEAEAVSDAYVAYIDAVKAGDGKKACALATPAFQRQAGRSIAVGPRADLRDASCVEAIEQGGLPQLQQVEPNLEDIEVDGERASGLDPGETVTVEGQQVVIGPQEVFFERLGGDWKIARTVFARPRPEG
jgi:hypothetical protein